MSLVPYLGLGAVALVAIAFVAWPLARMTGRGRWLLAGAMVLFLLGVGGGTYLIVGQPYLAWRAGQGLNTRDINGLIPYLITRVRKAPGDEQAWTYLGRAYMTANDPGDAAKALARAVTIARLNHKPEAALDSAYGEALVASSDGTVGPDAEAAFKATLAIDPKDAAARFFMGEALATQGDKEGALSLWQSLLADAPANTPLHQTLVDRIALLSAATPGGAPDVHAMVASLAARLKSNPNDAAGWQRLIRAYSVLGQRSDAQDALAGARKTFVKQSDVMAALDAEAKELKLD